MNFHPWWRKTPQQTAEALLKAAQEEASEAESALIIASDRYAAARAEAEYTRARVDRLILLGSSSLTIGTSGTD